MSLSTPAVGIIRHQQFRPSETFIVNQALALKDFRPLFVGRDPIRATEGVDSISVSDFGRSAQLSYTLTRRSNPLWEILKNRHVAVLHAHFGVEGVYAVPMAKALGVPLVTTLHGFDVTISRKEFLASRKPSWINYVLWRGDLFAHGASFVCVSEHIRRRAIAWGFPQDRLTVLPIGVDVGLIQPTLPVEMPRIVHVARLVEKKGTSDLLRAFAVVKRALADAELVIVGDGPLRRQLHALAQELGVGGSVRFLGALGHAETLHQLSRSRLLCLPSVTAANGDQEGLPTVCFEAAAAGKPIVGTDHGGIPEALLEGVNGYLVPEGDPSTLADRLLMLLRDPQLCEQFGAAGRRLAVERFNLHRQTARLEDLYRSLM
jgi:glycosyltransferase involved in cell wall biosynthesis